MLHTACDFTHNFALLWWFTLFCCKTNFVSNFHTFECKIFRYAVSTLPWRTAARIALLYPLANKPKPKPTVADPDKRLLVKLLTQTWSLWLNFRSWDVFFRAWAQKQQRMMLVSAFLRSSLKLLRRRLKEGERTWSGFATEPTWLSMWSCTRSRWSVVTNPETRILALESMLHLFRELVG